MRLADTLYRVPRRPGLQLIHKRGPDGARELSSWRLCLAAGARTRLQCPSEEAILVLQQGSGTFRCGDEAWPVRRAGVFAEPATALYLPPDVAVEVRADAPLEAVLVATPAPGDGGGPVFLPPSSVKVHERGRDGYARTVHDVLVDDDFARRLLVGETFNPPGNWSSFPPHKHDGRDGETRLEEVYHYRVDPPQGFAQQLLYARGGESVAHTVRDGDAVLLPYGYHPVAAPPGYRVYYLWALSGEVRRLTLYEDPDHRWIHDS
jgi:5-deoxy-glucuronate isomerase